jgi:hypothetical protein
MAINKIKEVLFYSEYRGRPLQHEFGIEVMKLKKLTWL